MCISSGLYDIKFTYSKDQLDPLLDFASPTSIGIAPSMPSRGTVTGLIIIGLLFERVGSGSDQKLKVGRLVYNSGQYEEDFSGLLPDIPLVEQITDLSEKAHYHNAFEFEKTFFPKAVIQDMLLIAQSIHDDYSDSKPSLLFQRGLVGPQQFFYKHTPDNEFYFPRKYCTMTVKPNPDPVPPLDIDGEPESYSQPVAMNESLSFYYAPPCPPIWWIGGGSLLTLSTTSVPLAPMGVVSKQYQGIAPTVYRLTRWESLLWGFRTAFLRRGPGGGRRPSRPQSSDQQQPLSSKPKDNVGKGS